jgi:hypothetical protein
MARLSERLSRSKRGRLANGGAALLKPTAVSSDNPTAVTTTAASTVARSPSPSLDKKVALAKAHANNKAQSTNNSNNNSSPVQSQPQQQHQQSSPVESFAENRELMEKRRKAIALGRLAKQMSPRNEDMQQQQYSNDITKNNSNNNASTPPRPTIGTRTPSPSPNRPRLRLGASPTPEKQQQQPLSAGRGANRPYNRFGYDDMSDELKETVAGVELVLASLSKKQPSNSDKAAPKAAVSLKQQQQQFVEDEEEELPKIEVVLGDKNVMQQRYGTAANLSVQLAPPMTPEQPPSPLRARLHERLSQPRTMLRQPSPGPPEQRQTNSPNTMVMMRDYASQEERMTTSPEQRAVEQLLQPYQPKRVHTPSPGRQPTVTNKNASNEPLPVSASQPLQTSRYTLKTVTATPPRPSVTAQNVTHSPPRVPGASLASNGNVSAAESSPIRQKSSWKQPSSTEQSPKLKEPATTVHVGSRTTQRPPSPALSRKWYLERQTQASQATMDATNPELEEDHGDIEQTRSDDTTTSAVSAKRWGVQLKQVGARDAKKTKSLRKFGKYYAAQKQAQSDNEIEQAPSVEMKESSSSGEFPESMTFEPEKMQEMASTASVAKKESTPGRSAVAYWARQRSSLSVTADPAIVTQSQAEEASYPPASPVAKAKWLVQRANERENQKSKNSEQDKEPLVESELAADSEKKVIVPSPNTAAASPSRRCPYQRSVSGKASSSTGHPATAGQTSQGTSGYGRLSPVPPANRVGTEQLKKPSWVREQPPSPSRQPSTPTAQSSCHGASPRGTTPYATPSAVARMYAQTSPRRSLVDTVQQQQQQEGTTSSIETPGKVSVSSMVGRFASPTASSSAKRSPRRAQQPQKSFPNDETQSQGPGTQSEAIVGRSVIETPDKVSVASMKGLFGNTGLSKSVDSRPEPIPRSKSFQSDRMTPTVPGPRSMSNEDALQQPEIYQQTITATKSTNSAPYRRKSTSSYGIATSNSWRRRATLEPAAQKESSVPPWVLRYKGDEKVVESAPRVESSPSVSSAGNVEHPEDEKNDAVPKDLPIEGHQAKSFHASDAKQTKPVEKRITTQPVQKDFEIVDAVPFNAVDEDNSMEPMKCPMSPPRERPWMDDVEALSPRSRSLRERIIQGKQSRAAAATGQEATDLTSRLAMIREKLRDHESSFMPSFSFGEEKKCEDLPPPPPPLLKSPNSLSRLAAGSIHAHDDDGVMRNFDNPAANYVEDDEESNLSAGCSGTIPSQKSLPPELARALSNDQQRYQIQSSNSSHDDVVFGDPETFSTKPVNAKAQAIDAWKGGLGTKPSRHDAVESISPSWSDGHPLIEIVDTKSSDMHENDQGFSQARQPAAQNSLVANEIAAAFVPAGDVAEQVASRKARVSAETHSSRVLQFWSATDRQEAEDAVSWKDKDPEPAYQENSSVFGDSFISADISKHDRLGHKPDDFNVEDSFFSTQGAPNPFSEANIVAFNDQQEPASVDKAFDPFFDTSMNEHDSFGNANALFHKAKVIPTSCASPTATTFSVPNFEPAVSKILNSKTLQSVVSTKKPLPPSLGEQDDVVWSYDADSVGSNGTPLSCGVEI